MRQIALVGIVLLSTIVGGKVYAAEDGTADAYKLLPGDRLQVSVWREDVLDREVVILPDGSITFPLAGRLVVKGKSTPEVEMAVAERLSEYLSEPVVTVTVTATLGHRVYLLGQVNNPGPVPMDGPTTISQILSLAGGFSRFADLDEIRILRGVGESAQYFTFNYDTLVSSEDSVSATMLLEAGDVIIIP